MAGLNQDLPVAFPNRGIWGGSCWWRVNPECPHLQFRVTGGNRKLPVTHVHVWAGGMRRCGRL